MQVVPSSTLRAVASRDALEARRPEAGAAPERVSGARRLPARASSRLPEETVTPPRAGLRGWDPQRQGRIATAQQAQGYLARLADQLQELKTAYGARLSTGDAPSPDAADPDRRLAALDRLWRQRMPASGGALDAQLRFQGPDGARQWFRVRGLDRQALAQGASERLGFGLPGLPGALATVTVEPELGAEANHRRLDHALAPAGVRVSADAAGEPVFSVPQARWAQVRDQLTVRGEGRRYPDGLPQRVRVEPEPEALAPAAWQAMWQDQAELRQVLQQILRALDRVREAQRQVSEELARAAADTAVLAPADGRMARFADGFAAQAAEPRFEVHQALAPALAGISRERVLALLAAR